ncbi:AraC family transcriptional regulator [Pedobacter heparinus]|uniref:Helix-turn-helix-domain containing protein AraC type n=1 Tax=Pedobacter heparinus (strain ATCC 13125 / DSM 2366 / CIP 104194 / JCM 7457 / NBRC 12017 / NCIMB 9290 / NRRL B-14731 / HIM 762-3) TaxID=485917 RepID=C6XYR9_PEDHD|nr:AraC family transcriptional regulator [Pedobacter heparinus]ACU04551.1 helix-turn-helix- domain containing protein AraC type [Pedobacter heparinus DSM 2366]
MPRRIKTISEFHKLRGLPQPEHPLISVIDYGSVAHVSEQTESFVFDFYSISLKRGVGKMRYGQQEYDFDGGVMYFMAPGQVLTVEPGQNSKEQRSGWILKVHPDLLWNTPLAKIISQYEFFDYSVHEALFLSDKEEEILNGIVTNIRQEYGNNIDKFSHNIIVSQIETLLNYAERFYQRQFITRKKSGHQLLEKMEAVLDSYFNDVDAPKGLPSVQYVSDRLHVSKGYLASLLKSLTGLNTQQHIHEKLIEKAKTKLSTTDLSVSQIAYELGFEHPQSFSKLFKNKTNLSPLEFKNSFN